MAKTASKKNGRKAKPEAGATAGGGDDAASTATRGKPNGANGTSAKGKKRQRQEAPPLDEVDQRIDAHCKFLDAMFELVPARFYFHSDTSSAAAAMENKYAKNKKGQAPKQKTKDNTKKAKRMKLDPARQRSNAELLRGAHDFEARSEEAPLPMEALRERMKSRMEALRHERASSGGGTERHDRPRLKEGRVVAPSRRREDDDAGSAQVEPETEADYEFRLKHAAESGLSTEAAMALTASGKHFKKTSDRDLLKKAQKFERRLEGADEKTRLEMTDEHDWASAMERADGKRVKDDPKLIKKSMKRKENVKKKSQKAWAARIADQKQRVIEEKRKKQAKRETRESKKKGGKKKSTSKARPGFEGKTQKAVFDNRGSKKTKGLTSAKKAY